MKASPSFAHLVRDAAKQVPYPTIAGSTPWDARKDRGKLYGNLSDEAIAQINAGMDTGITDVSGPWVWTVIIQISYRRPECAHQKIHLGSDLYSPRSPAYKFGFDSTRLDAVYHYRYLIQNVG